MSEFCEDKHPRDESGKFSSGGSGATSSDTHSNLSPKSVSESQKQSLYEYSKNGYKKMNSTLRDGGKLAPKMQKAINDIESTMVEIKAPITVYRGVSKEMSDKLAVGSSFKDGAFVSTTTDPKVAQREFSRAYGTLMEVTVAKGSKAVSLKEVSHSPSESEILLGRGMTFTVTGYKTVDGRKIAQVEAKNG